ncbi:hybrid sensor histidine kinase/response regulator [Scytonema hofmannii PCC 7110]|uniref:histidine kinase n=1 Tax=Scytonema hofmannii PCC 7110 TaxID=128403 RepID=A0A139X1B7_9CYAN|nr:ATP-binding protein [Scytonema hofmannii]KYC38422.1 hybrid sensor histidine kinase/response regulator [Scytonema hofmannii PCC 7110]
MEQRTVLIIDDCAEDREVYRRYLLQDHEYRYTILEEESGKGGLMLCQQFKPDSILLNYVLPDMDGLGFLAQLQQQTQGNFPPAIVLAERGYESVVMQAMKKGVRDYLVKEQMTASDLLFALNHAMEYSRMQESQKLLQEITNTTPGILYVHDILELHNVYINRRTTEVIGYTPQQIQDMGSGVLEELMHPEDLVRLPEHFQRFDLVEDGKIVEFEYRMRHANGEWRWFCSQETVFKRNSDGSVQQILGTALDITRHKRAEVTLKQQLLREQLVTKIAQHIRQSLKLEEIFKTTVDEVRQFLQTDRVLLFRLEPDGSGTVVMESVSPDWSPILLTNIFDPCFRDSWVDPYRLGLVVAKTDIYNAGIDPCHVELLSRFQVRANLVVPVLQKEQLWGLLIAHHCAAPRQWHQIEIDLLKQLATQVGIAIQQATLLEQAESANRAKDEFVAMVTHDLRTPLNAVLGWTHLLQRLKLDEAGFARGLESIEQSARFQEKLLEDLQDITRIIQGQLKLQVSEVNLVDVIQAALETAYPLAYDKSLCIESILDNSMETISGDPKRLQQVLGNLLSNSIKFTPEGGRIEVRLEQVDSFAQITVSDTGCGISADFLPCVFERYQQANGDRTRDGLGLGLAIARHLIEAHNGTIEVTSPGLGQGATFTIKLPLASKKE